MKDAQAPDLQLRLRDLRTRLSDIEREIAGVEKQTRSEEPLLSRAFADRLTDGVFVVAEGQIRWANNSAAELLGRSNASLTKVPLADVFQSVRNPGEWLRARVKDGATSVEFVTATGGVVKTLAEVHHNGGEVFVIIVRRIALPSRIEVKETVDLEHSVRTPMVGVLGMAELLATTNLDPPQRELLETILTSSRMLIEGLDQRQGSCGNDEFDLYMFLDEFSRVYGRFAQQKGLGFDLVLDPSLPRYVHGDSSRLKQVLSHLVSNAVKFTPAGEVQVTVVFADDWRVRFVVEDTGVGMADASRDRLLRAFRQTDLGPSQRPLGLGMGLAVSKRIVDSLGGEMGVESTEGKGSRFWFSAVVNAARSGSDSGAAPVTSSAVLSVLCAEDDAINRQVIRRMLETLGCRCATVNNGQELLEELRRGRYDVVLLDCQMPVLDGYESAAKIRDYGLSGVPLIALTANANVADRQRCLELGMSDYLSKPVTLEALRAAFRRLRLPLARSK